MAKMTGRRIAGPDSFAIVLPSCRGGTMFRVFTPPVFADSERTEAARTLYLIVGLVAVTFTLLIGLLGPLVMPHNIARWLAAALAADAIGLAALGLARRGHVRLAGTAFLALLWALLTCLAFTANGIHSPAVSEYVIIVFAAGPLLGERWGIAVGGWCGLSALGLVVAESLHLLPPNTVSENALSTWIGLVLAIFSAIGLQYLATDSLRRALRQARREAAEREQSETQLEAALHALGASEDRFRSLTEQAPVAIGIYRGGQKVYVNPTYARIFGFANAQEAAGRPIFEIIAPQYREEETRHHLRYLAGLEATSTRETVGLRLDGSQFPLQMNLTHVMLPDGPAIVGFLSDITERKTAESAREATLRAVQESETRFREIFEQAAVGITHARLDGRFLRANQKLCDMLGYAEAEVLEHSFQELTHPEDLDAEVSNWKRMLATEIQTYSMEKRLLRKDHSIVWVKVTVSMAGKSGEAPARTIAVIEDLTANKQMEDDIRRQRGQLEHLSRVSSMGELTAALAHELNQPIAAIVASAQAARRFLTQEQPDLPEVQEALDDIAEDGQRAGEVIHRMRALLRRGDLVHTALDANQVIRETIVLVRSEAILRGISLRLELAQDLPLVYGDRVQLQQVLLNLLINGMDAMRVPGKRAATLVVQSRLRSAEQIEITVQDAGEGLDGQTLAHMFDAFFSTKPDGLGMGLTISRSIVRAHDGQIWATRNPAGPGVTVHVVLPVGQEVGP